MNGNMKTQESLKTKCKPRVDDTAVIVAGMGRCGTTLLHDALVDYGFKETAFLNTFGECFIYRYGKVYKIHYYLPPDKFHYNVKLIYMFGNPYDIAISATKNINDWGKLHHAHLGSDLFVENKELYYKDTLQLNRHFDMWYRQQGFSFLSIKYETLYEYKTRQMLNQYLGIVLKLPPYRKRESSWENHPHRQDIISTYRELHAKIECAENVKIWEKKV